MTLQQPGHQRIVDLICEICTRLSAFHGAQNAELRSVVACERYLIRMAGGGYMK